MRRAIGATGSMMVSHVLTTSTSRMALRDTFLRVDFEPRVATSLGSEGQQLTRLEHEEEEDWIPDGRDAIFARSEDCTNTLVCMAMRDRALM